MMQRERSDVYIIPPNFAKEGTLFPGRIEGRNAFEAAVLFIVLFRILFFIDVSIKLRIYIGIIVILPLTILAVVGVNGESLLSFIIQFIRFVTRRRVVTVPDGQYRLKRNRRIRRQQKKQQKQERKKKKRQQEGGVKDRKQKLKEAQLAEKRERREQKQQQREDKAMSRKQEKENRQMQKEQQKKDAQKQKEQARENFRQIREQEAEERNLRNQLVQNVEKEERPVRPPKKELSRKEEKSEKVQEVPDLLPMSWTASYIPLKQVKNGIIQTSDNRFVKIVEVLPINFLLRSSSEQRSIILSFMSYLKIAPPNIQLKVLSRKADIQEYIDKIDEEAEKETDERCKILQEDYAELIKSLGMKEAITRRFFLIFEYPSRSGSKNPDERDVHLYMRSAVQTAKKYLAMCGNIVLEHENETRFCVEILYQLLNRQTCLTESLNDRIKEVRKYYTEENGPESIRYIPVTELVAPRTIDFRNWNYVVVDGLYYTYLYVQKYRSRVPAGWLSLLINAGEGIDIDVFFFKQDKNRCVERIGRRIRLNRSKIKDTYDSNSDFDSLSESIQAGYYLKRGLSGSEEFYYMSILVTITGHSEQEVEWRSKEMTKLLSSQDIGTGSCIFREEQAFLSSLPFLQIDKNIYEKSKRNVLTSGVAACYPFASYEMSDKDGIMIGVNKANSSLVIIDIFNSLKYKNANIAIFGTSGSGKTFLMQLMALRMRQKNIQVFIIAPDKGHEFARACNNIGGEFIQISPSSSNCINIMEIRPADMETRDLLDGYTSERSELASKIQSLHIFFSLLIPDMSHEEKQLLDGAMVTCYQEKGITHDNLSLTDPEHPGKYKKMPILGDLHEVLMRKEECRRMANILNRLVSG